MTYYVDSENGLDTNNGSTMALAFETIDKAFDEVAANDTIILQANTTPYPWTARTSGDAIPDGVTIEGTLIPNTVTGVAAKIDAAGNSRTWRCDGSIYANNIWFANNLTSGGAAGIELHFSFTGFRNAHFTNCIFNNIRAGWSTGGRGGFIGKGGNLSNDEAIGQDIKFVGCLIYEAENSGSLGTFVRPSFGGTFLMENCTYYSGTPSGDALTAICAGVEQSSAIFRNMIIHNQSGLDLCLHDGSTGTLNAPNARPATLEGSVYNNLIETNVTINESTEGDPLFLDITTNDFRVRQNSPAIDRGVLI